MPVTTVVVSYLEPPRASAWPFQAVFDLPAWMSRCRCCLVALAIDYNVFLTTRARKEAAMHQTRERMTNELAVTTARDRTAGSNA